MDSREFKDSIYSQFARISKALSSPKRFEIMDYLTQGEKTVEKLSQETKMSVANTSKHLQSLLEAKLVKTRKEKNYVYYSISDENVMNVIFTIKQLAEDKFSDLPHWRKNYIEKNDSIPVVKLEDIIQKIQDKKAMLIDVRPKDEFETAHIRGAESIPIDHLKDHIISLPKDKVIYTYCRGPYCVFASEAVEYLRDHGFEAYRIEEGVNEWKKHKLVLKKT